MSTRNKIRRCKLSDNVFVRTDYKHDGRGGIQAFLIWGNNGISVRSKAKMLQLAKLFAAAVGHEVVKP